MQVRDAKPEEIERLAVLWHDAWHQAHAAIVPAELTRSLTLEGFRDRLNAAMPAVRVVGPVGEPVGFCLLRGGELHQLFVAAAELGSAAEIALLDDAERLMWSVGVRRAWAACAIGNHRAARFYQTRGWSFAGTMVSQVETPAGPFQLTVWRYEKSLRPRAA